MPQFSREPTREGNIRLIVATDESPESFANRPFLSLPLSLLIGRRWRWWRLRLLGLGGEVGEGRPCVLAREMEDALPTGHFGTGVYSFGVFRPCWLVCGRGRGDASIGGGTRVGGGRGGKYRIGVVRCGGGRDGCVMLRSR